MDILYITMWSACAWLDFHEQFFIVHIFHCAWYTPAHSMLLPLVGATHSHHLSLSVGFALVYGALG